VDAQRSYAGEAADPYCLADGEAARLLAGHPWRRFAVLGDSIAEGVGEPAPGYADEPWCDRIAAALRTGQPGLAYLNLGTSNTPAAQVAAGQLPPALEFGPDLALVACGGYDILQFSYDADAVTAEIATIVTTLAATGATVVTVGLFDGSYSPVVPEPYRKPLQQRLHGLSVATRQIAAQAGTLHVDLTWHPAARDPDLYASDGKHGTMRGHAISAAEVIKGLGGELAIRRQRPAAPEAAGPAGAHAAGGQEPG
jgi:lysophospholipase L1-like esterase